MTKLFEQAIAEAAALPEATQEEIGRELLEHIENFRRLRADIQQGLRSLEKGEGRPINIEDVLKRARAKYAEG